MKFHVLKLSRPGWSIISGLYLTIFLTILVLAYTGQLPTQLLLGIPYADKIGHVVLYCIAAFVGHRVLKQRHTRLLGRPAPLFPMLFGLFTVVEEGVQGFAPNRTLDGVDLAASLIGVLLGYWLAEHWRIRN